MDRDEFVNIVERNTLTLEKGGADDDLRKYTDKICDFFAMGSNTDGLCSFDACAFGLAYVIATELSEKRVSQLAGQRTRDVMMG